MSYNLGRRLERQQRKDAHAVGPKSRRSWGRVNRGPGVTKKLSNQPRKAKR